MNRRDAPSADSGDDRAPERALDEPTLPGFDDAPNADHGRGRAQAQVEGHDDDAGGDPTPWRDQLTLPGYEADRR